jgi:hypothetical protein
MDGWMVSNKWLPASVGARNQGLGAGKGSGGRFGYFALLFEAQNMGLSRGSVESTADFDRLHNLRSVETIGGGIEGFEDCRFDVVGAPIGDGLPHEDSAGARIFDCETELNVLQIGVAVFLAADRSDFGETMAP